MRRREFIAIGGVALAWPWAARSQSPSLARIGILGSEDTPPWEGFRQGLRDLGYIDGRNVTLEWRWSHAKADRFPALAKELVDLNVDVIVTSTVPATFAVKRATATIPIVMALSPYPDKIGLVDSLARPGGNVTGLSHVAVELMGKRLELAKEIAITRIALVWNPSNTLIEPIGFREASTAAERLGVTIQSVEVQNPEDFPMASKRALANRPDALYAIGNQVNFRGRKLIVDFAAEHRLASIFEERLFVADGGLMSYAPSSIDLFRRAASYVDRILRGASPADLPIELPTKFELVLNLKTAKAIGLTVPNTLLARADEVIE